METRLVIGTAVCAALTAVAFFMLLPTGPNSPVGLGIAIFAFAVSRALLFGKWADQRVVAITDSLLLVAFATGVILLQVHGGGDS